VSTSSIKIECSQDKAIAVKIGEKNHHPNRSRFQSQFATGFEKGCMSVFAKGLFVDTGKASSTEVKNIFIRAP